MCAESKSFCNKYSSCKHYMCLERKLAFISLMGTINSFVKYVSIVQGFANKGMIISEMQKSVLFLYT